MPLIQRLRERKLVQWALAYLAGAWVLYEAASTVGGHFGLSDLVFRGLFVVLAAGSAAHDGRIDVMRRVHPKVATGNTGAWTRSAREPSRPSFVL